MQPIINDEQVCLEVNSQSLGYVVQSKYYVKRMQKIHPRLEKLYFIWERNEDKKGQGYVKGFDRFVSDHKTEEDAYKACANLNNAWSLHHPDTPNPHKCCQGLWVPSQRRWDHYPDCRSKS